MSGPVTPLAGEISSITMRLVRYPSEVSRKTDFYKSPYRLVLKRYGPVTLHVHQGVWDGREGSSEMGCQTIPRFTPFTPLGAPL